jgi:hypothetical protein
MPPTDIKTSSLKPTLRGSPRAKKEQRCQQEGGKIMHHEGKEVANFSL